MGQLAVVLLGWAPRYHVIWFINCGQQLLQVRLASCSMMSVLQRFIGTSYMVYVQLPQRLHYSDPVLLAQHDVAYAHACMPRSTIVACSGFDAESTKLATYAPAAVVPASSARTICSGTGSCVSAWSSPCCLLYKLFAPLQC